MDNAIVTLHDFMLRTESITYILVVVVLVGFPFFWRFLTDREEDAVQSDADHAPDKHH
jgi:hypothetical protein